MKHAAASRISIHRIVQNGAQDDSLGSVLGSRTCPWGITLQNISVADVHIPALGGANVFSSLWAVGTLGAPQGRFAKVSNLDRWYFCSNAWWLDGQQVLEKGRAVTMSDLTFAGWTAGPQGAAGSFLYNFHAGASSAFERLRFNAVRVASLTNVSGERRLGPEGA